MQWVFVNEVSLRINRRRCGGCCSNRFLYYSGPDLDPPTGVDLYVEVIFRHEGDASQQALVGDAAEIEFQYNGESKFEKAIKIRTMSLGGSRYAVVFKLVRTNFAKGMAGYTDMRLNVDDLGSRERMRFVSVWISDRDPREDPKPCGDMGDVRRQCGSCKALVDNFAGDKPLHSSCDAYCEAQTAHLVCVGAWVDIDDSCENPTEAACGDNIYSKFNSTDAICECLNTSIPSPSPTTAAFADEARLAAAEARCQTKYIDAGCSQKGQFWDCYVGVTGVPKCTDFIECEIGTNFQSKAGSNTTNRECTPCREGIAGDRKPRQATQ